MTTFRSASRTDPPDRDAAPSGSSSASLPWTIPARRAYRPGPGCLNACLLRLMIALIVFGVAAVVIVGVLLERSDRITIDRSPPRIVGGPAFVLPAPDGAPGDVLITSRAGDAPTYRLSRLTPGGNVVWDGPTLRGDPAAAQIAIDGETIIVAGEEPRLLALDRESGDTRWTAALDTPIDPACQGCVQMTGDHVIVLTSDGILAGLDAASGDPQWQTTLDAPPDRLYDFGGLPAVVRPSGDAATLTILDPASGEILRAVEPRCAGDAEAATLDPNSPLLYDPATRGIVVLLGQGRQGCAQRWDAATGQMAWQTSADSTAYAWRDGEPLLAGGAIYIGGEPEDPSQGAAVLALDLATGALRQTVSAEGYDLRPLAVDGDVLVAQATRTAGSRREELWGVSATSDRRYWRYALDPDASSWAAHPGASGVAIVQSLPGPDRLAVDLLDPVTGRSLHRTVTPVEDTAWTGITWQDDAAWLALDRLYRIDLTSGAITPIWP